MIKKLLDKIFRPRKHTAERENLPHHPPEVSTQHAKKSRPVLGTKKSAKRNSSNKDKAEIITLKKHQIDRDLLSNAAARTIDGLQKAGFEAYIVGGAVRDLLLNRNPKDFDIATDATPEEVNRVFRRSRIIGRRFRLVHVMFGDETIEVSTFRGHHQAEGDSHTNESGRITRDNVFGSLEEDAARRDFTANALYYDPTSQEVLDFHHGFADIRAGLLRIIGKPETRYIEDPVRMLRAVRLSAKLGLKIDPATQAPIAKMADLLQGVPPSRLFDEMLKLFLSGHAIESVNALREQHLHHGLLPMLDVVLEQPMGERFVMLALKNTDDRILSGKSANPSFLFATLLWHEVLAAWATYKAQNNPPIPALHLAMNDVLASQAEKLAIHNRYTATMREIWGLQPRFEQRAGKRPFGLLTHPRYRAGYDFLLLRCESGEVPAELGAWWTTFAEAEGEERAAMLQPDTAPKKRRKRKPKKAVSSTPATS
ncbi:MAG: poly(A) polymerase [Methylotenera sp. 24-45-7]|jgi:poly(A) polymerase|nr:MAG: poly(A) polymerase [Mehylophilales bacterium 35-46-6]OYZ41084.1 MAG: poly(A) polymerase [Methylotenera sp. 24-45-7]OZA53405.1 MAG: poly(A) polymerase [Methylophilales bacterium 39-45-7]HQS37525.1 polynucleotide adenylyltransferase PcnB [Methylotenera sp.]HQS42870.1 polynucleotide adenylyltransferase PcnB [Methylotenera sp.]